MSDTSQAPLVVKYLNSGLFADYYLREIVPTRPEWLADDFHIEAGRVFKALKTLRANVHPETLDEAQLEKEWVQPVFDLLGHHYKVQVKIRYREEGHRKPDYLFLTTPADVTALTSDIYNPPDIAHAIAVGDAKKWGVNLDQTSKSDKRNPSQQIDEYLRYSELNWGILTDGRYWRLYHRETSKYNTYYAIDLEQLLTLGDEDSFLYFYAFFRQAAWTTGWLNLVLAGSVEFAQRLTDRLEEEVYEALEMLAQGFLDYRRNHLKPDAATLRLIYEQSLVLLYRLLFIFYAESREILPLQNAEYISHYSLQSIKYQARNLLDIHAVLDADKTDFYSKLQDLFFSIDAGNPRIDMPPYNGHLFSSTAHPFLNDKDVGDAFLVPALDKLARVDVTEKNKTRRVFVDYRDLDVRHLGSIYEKLLEYDLDIADQPLMLKDGEYKPATGNAAVIKKPGEVYLRTGNNTRKATGSYYTPDYIVRFIVEKTLQPLLIEITSRFATQNEEGRWQVHPGQEQALIRAILDLNVLDPATGSGHFIVDATSYIAEWISRLGIRPDDLGQENELIYWKRQVASACVYAVDINPLAVELARLSMWLTTLAKGKPLSFLDHHLRVGNSLVGARMSDLSDSKEEARLLTKRQQQAQKAASRGQASMFTDEDFAQNVRFAVEQMAEIEAARPIHVQEVKAQEQRYFDLRQRLQGWEQAANVSVAQKFGLSVPSEVWQLIRKQQGLDIPHVSRILTEATEIAKKPEHRFFHWELMFPEVFFDAQGQAKPDAGFDAVIGNPPYVRQERISSIKPFLQDRYRVYSGTADLFLYFYELGLEFVKPSHRVGYITSGTYMNSNSAKPFREYIAEQAAPDWAVNFGENQPFKGAEMVYPTMIVLKREKRTPTFKSLFVEDVYKWNELGNALNLPPSDADSSVLELEEWRFQPIEFTRLFKKITQDKQSLDHHVSGKIYRGILTGLNEAFIVDGQTRQALINEHKPSEEIIKPIVRGENLRPWYQINDGLYLIWSYKGIEIDRYPAVKNHLLKHKDALAKRWEASKGQIRWYELRPCDYYREFDEAKIFGPDIAKLPRFSWDQSSLYCNDKGFFVLAPLSTLAVLNSRVTWFALSQIATPLRLRAGLWQYQTKIQFLKRLPIPALTTQQESNLTSLAGEITTLAKQRYQAHEQMRHRISTDLGEKQSLNNALWDWWDLPDGAALRAEVKKAFKRDILLAERSDWEKYLADQQALHKRLTASIVEREIRLNSIVYDAFDLTAEERALIEEATRYPYGEV